MVQVPLPHWWNEWTVCKAVYDRDQVKASDMLCYSLPKVLSQGAVASCLLEMSRLLAEGLILSQLGSTRHLFIYYMKCWLGANTIRSHACGAKHYKNLTCWWGDSIKMLVGN